jgi:Mn2+/Fe2+ NRAMP family transporter
VRKFFGIALGILTAVGGFVDIGDIVTSALVGARFGMALAWAVALGLVGIVVYAEMAGRVAAVSKRPVFELVRERLGARVALVNLFASMLINVLTLTAEIAGVAIALQLATSINYLWWLPVAAFVVWLVIWRVRFSLLENVFGLLGLAIAVFVVMLVRYGADWGHLWSQATTPTVPQGEGHATFLYYGIALFGATMTPYEVFFFSSGAVEEDWSTEDLSVSRANVFIGFPLGALLSLAIMAAAALILQPRNISVEQLSQVALPVSLVLGKVGLAIVIFGFFITTFGAALETGLSSGYAAAQYFGWQWGKFVKPREAPRFHLIVLGSIIVALLLGITSLDPVKITEYSVVLSAAALPLTYFPILVVANDPDYMGDHVNRPWSNAIATVYLVIVVAVAVATIPLMIATKAGQ